VLVSQEVLHFLVDSLGHAEHSVEFIPRASESVGEGSIHIKAGLSVVLAHVDRLCFDVGVLDFVHGGAGGGGGVKGRRGVELALVMVANPLAFEDDEAKEFFELVEGVADFEDFFLCIFAVWLHVGGFFSLRGLWRVEFLLFYRVHFDHLMVSGV